MESYSLFFRMGIINGMNRELPYAMGQGNDNLAIKYAETTLSFTLMNILAFIVLALPIIYTLNIEQTWSFPLIVVLIIASVNFYNTYLLGTFRAKADFNRLSKIQMVHGLLKIASIILVVWWGFNGFVFRELFIVLITTFLAYIFRPLKMVKPKFNRTVFLTLLKVGFPIFISSYAIVFIGTIPRLILLNFGNVSMIGVYAPLLTIITTISVIPDSIGNFLYPQMTHEMGKTNNRLSFWKRSLFTHFGLIIIGIPLVTACVFIVPYLIDNFIPKYAESKSIIGIGIFSSLFMSYKFGYTILITLKEWRLIIIYIASFAFLQLAVPLVLLNYVPTLMAVVIGQLVCSFLMVAVSLTTNYIATNSYGPLVMKHN